LWSRGARRSTLAGQLLLLQLAVIAVVLGIVAAISVRQSTATFGDERGSQMRSVAEYLANVAVVRSQVGDPDAARSLAPAVDRALRLSGATRVYVAASDGTVVASSEPADVGRPADLEGSRVQEGRGWSGDVTLDGERAVAAHAPVLDDTGRLVGLTVAEQDYPSTWELLTDSASDLAIFLGVGAALGVAGSWLVSRIVRRRTRGLGTVEIATLADHREALLHSIREGVVAVGREGRVTLLNDGARVLLGLGEDAVGRPVADLGLEPEVATLLTGTAEVHDAVVLVRGRVLVLNHRPASSRGAGIGSVTTMRDRTEVVAVQNQLSSNLSITDTLRAQTHEFANQLHTISGLVQLGEYDEVRTLVGTLSRRRAETDAAVAERVRDPAVAALLVAKSSLAAEAGVALELDRSSSLPALAPVDSADLTTVLGNLVDNAVDACRGRAAATVTVHLAATDERVVLEVHDDGPGVPAELRESVFVRGFSTKPDVPGGRGIGLPLVRMICTERGGSVTLADPGDGRDGATFRVELPRDAARPQER
jgi:sensor histidine kinase regulating citrate/malate metabolism